MGESVTDIPCLQQSVSFGRFERDSLCWERWSTFPTNKYLEEVEKFSTPGSVAQKKAYFEAHYKKIAARRAELLLDQEREREAELVNSEEAGFTSSVDNTSEVELDYGKTDIDNSVSETDQWENEVGIFDDEVSVEHVHVKSHSTENFYRENKMASFNSEVSVEHIHMQSNSAEEISSFDDDVSVEHIHRESNTDDTLNVENEMGSFDGDVSVEHIHVDSNIADLLILENEVGSFDGEHVHVKGGSSDGFSQEAHVCDLPSEMSGHDDVAHKFNGVNKLSNVTEEKFKDVVEFKNGDDTVEEASDVMKNEVTLAIRELKDGADVIDEVVKIEATEHVDKPDDGTDIIIKGNNQQCQEKTASTDSCLSLKIPELGKLKESTSATEGVPSIFESKGEELPQEKVKRTIVEEDGRNLMKVATSKKSQKATLAKKVTSTSDTKKKPASPIPKRITTPMPKSPMLSTPISSKPEITRAAKPVSRVLDKKDNSFTPPTNKKAIEPQMKRAVPTSLHMSLSLEPLNADPASFTMRKSLIMETMGDKDIVKRAFKAFQKPPQTCPSNVARSPATKQDVSRKAEQKGSPANTLQKKIDGSGRTPKIANTPTRPGQQGTRKALLSPGLNKKSGADHKNVKYVAVSFGPRVQLQENNHTVVSKKVESKIRTNVFEATNPEVKLKAEKAVQLKKQTESMNSASKVRSSYNQTRRIST